ncbi:hypothetical protein HYZ76_01860 [Candidatus Falkowbacteria bacterium]|nr:hypothetical protein [Candidatus Falkowbacteria bacterium]
MKIEKNNLIKDIKNLKNEIKPRPDWVNLSRAVLLQKINSPEKLPGGSVGLSGYIAVFSQIFRQRLLEPAVVMLLVLGVTLGSSLTINAAFYSSPGDNLYPVKLALERTHVALVPDEEDKIELKIEFAQKRVAEFDKIVQDPNSNPEEKKKKIETVVKELKNNVAAVSSHLNKINQSIASANVNASDKEQRVRIAISISSKTEELVKSVEESVGSLSEVEKLEVEKVIADAVEAAQGTSISVQQLAEDIDQNQTEEEGTVEGANNENELEISVDGESFEENVENVEVEAEESLNQLANQAENE